MEEADHSIRDGERSFMNLSIQAGTPIIVFCVAGVAVALALGIRQIMLYPMPRWKTVILTALRLLVVLCVAFTILRPEIISTIEDDSEPQLVVLVDSSESMLTKDVVTQRGTANFAIKRSEWVSGQMDDKFFDQFQSQFKVSVVPFAMPGVKDGEMSPSGTDLSYALGELLAPFKALRAVVLLSDGDWNHGPSPVGAAAALRAASVTVFPVATGSMEYLPDLELMQVKAPSFCLLGEKIAIPFQVQSRMPKDVNTKVTLSSPYSSDIIKEIFIPAGQSVQDSIIWHPSDTGAHRLALDLPVQPDELIVDNNRSSFSIEVRKEIIKVLVVESLPRWEYRYLRNALMRDPGVSVKTLLLHPKIGPGGGRGYIRQFPSKDEILDFDVIFLGDVGLSPDELSEEQLSLVEGLVRHHGSGLVLLPGRRGRHVSLMKTPVSDAYPVLLDETLPQGISSGVPSAMELSSEGRDHFLTMLADTPNANADVWRSLPGFSWNAAVKRTLPGSNVIAIHSGLRLGAARMPILVTREHGSGNVLFMGIDSAWRWRKGVEDKYHYRFWGQVVRWMAHKRHIAKDAGIRCFFLPEAPQLGATVFCMPLFTTALTSLLRMPRWMCRCCPRIPEARQRSSGCSPTKANGASTGGASPRRHQGYTPSHCDARRTTPS
jgi:hypothetical protein